MNSPGDNVIQKWETPEKHISIASGKRKGEEDTIYYANPIMYSFAELEEMAEWCYDTFGPQGYNQSTMQSAWDFQNDPDYIFWFREEKHLMMFILRWS